MPVFGAAVGLAVLILLVERHDLHSLEKSTRGLLAEKGLIRVVGPRVSVAEEVAGEPCAGTQARADQTPDSSEVNVPTSIRRNDIPVLHGSVSDLDSILDIWLDAQADGIACVIGTGDIEAGTFRATSRVRTLTPELSKGLEFNLVVLIDPEAFGTGIEGAVDRYVAMSRATQRLVILTSP
jgi:hypothetical protein